MTKKNLPAAREKARTAMERRDDALVDLVEAENAFHKASGDAFRSAEMTREHAFDALVEACIEFDERFVTLRQMEKEAGVPAGCLCCEEPIRQTQPHRH